jgi:HAD superfamily hydrolase (TIGR01509 family)
MKIEAVILDLGGVLLDVDYHASSHAFTALGVEDFDRLFSQYASSDLFEQLETGRIAPTDFYQELAPHCAPGTTVEQMESAWNAMLGAFRPASIAFLDALQKQVPLYLLSNTNQIHWEAFMQSYQRHFGQVNLDDYFVEAWYSHQIGMRKPYAETYRTLVTRAGLSISNTLFIDDSHNNIDGAKAAGLQTYWLQANERIEALSILHTLAV